MKKLNRGSGLLLHITSLPGQYGIGEIGPEARSFIDNLFEMGQRYWQFLPTNCPESYNSPYDTNSAFAQNPLLISLDDLLDDGLIEEKDIKPLPYFKTDRIEFDKLKTWKSPILSRAVENFLLHNDSKELEQYNQFCIKNDYWLHDYALFMVIKDLEQRATWAEWNLKFKQMENEALKEIESRFSLQIKKIRVLQYLFYKQWKSLKDYANKKGIKLIGDIPIYISYNSADVWVNQSLFKLDKDGIMRFQSGCPPDSWSETGQVWGHPIYDWGKHKEEGFKWWTSRILNLLELVDIIRIDHFNGFAKYWEVPALDKDGLRGKWVNGKGDELLHTAFKNQENLSFIAEDLGEAAPDALILCKKYKIPGMHILQFSFHDENPFENIEENKVVYTGTHDNDTSMGWYKNIKNDTENLSKEKDCIHATLSLESKELNWSMIEYCLRSNAIISIIPIQDLLGLGSSARMNTPGTVSDLNWSWRMESNDLSRIIIQKMKQLTKDTSRI